MVKVRIKRVGNLFRIEYKKGFFSRWKSVAELGMAGHTDNLKAAYDRASRVKKAFKHRPLVEIVEVL